MSVDAPGYWTGKGDVEKLKIAGMELPAVIEV
jgi:hypothetical protein